MSDAKTNEDLLLNICPSCGYDKEDKFSCTAGFAPKDAFGDPWVMACANCGLIMYGDSGRVCIAKKKLINKELAVKLVKNFFKDFDSDYVIERSGIEFEPVKSDDKLKVLGISNSGPFDPKTQSLNGGDDENDKGDN